ncbi:cell division protein FtsZ [Mesoplasma coleopterae]|uniref:Cell division protein FtsZ n=1 Tax=Mesoplasma coleopterae TaxID=324078 RepID=A0A2K8P459_9MOLU|nr:cell division protein FtsZ [Mesoplasma coleopterae]ATZ20920.1 cell division protein FtsZ [Mesoplasma coleopterae]AVN62417.1 cell division protein FtsZ [Mesoplasma coleopterae]
MNNNAQEFSQKAKIKVIGVGGGGNNAVSRMFEQGAHGVDFYIANTDAQVLAGSNVPNKIILGEKSTKGLGAGANPEVGKTAALESENELKAALEGADLIFVTAGMGGGTGTGAAPVIARIAQETGALVVAIVTKPFRFEGKYRNTFAEEGIIELKKYVDSTIVISNDRLLEFIGAKPIQEAFGEADAILKQGVQTITDLIAVPALINLDFADVKTVMSKKGNALFGIGLGTGPDKANLAANDAISSTLLEAAIAGAKDVIVNVTGGEGISLNDAYDVVDVVNQAIDNPEVNIVFGVAINKELTEKDELVVTVIATGFDEEMMKTTTSLGTKSNATSTFANLRTSSLYKSTHVEEEPKVQTSFEEDVLHAHQTMHSANNTTSNYSDETEDDFPTFLK